MEWIDINNALPTYEKDVLVWCLWGHKLERQIASLHDGNGENGYTEWFSPFGVYKKPNDPFPKNLQWNNQGHWMKYEDVQYWMELPPEPITLS